MVKKHVTRLGILITMGALVAALCSGCNGGKDGGGTGGTWTTKDGCAKWLEANLELAKTAGAPSPSPAQLKEASNKCEAKMGSCTKAEFDLIIAQGGKAGLPAGVTKACGEGLAAFGAPS